MRKRDISFTIALCASLIVHAGISMTMSESYVRRFGRRIWTPGYARASLAEIDVPQMAMFRPEDDPQLRLGESDASGTAIDSSGGDEPMLAPQGLQDQPFLSRDPIGPGKIGDPPTESTALPGDGRAAALTPPPMPADSEPAPVGLPLPRETAPAPKSEPAPLSEDEDATQAVPAPPSPAAAAPANPAAHSNAAQPGGPTAADPAPKGESEIDPISVIGSVDFRRGSTVARLGRAHKLTRPRMTLGGKVDLMTIGSTLLVLKLSTDATGNVSSVDVARSSGSEDVDQLFRVTAYEWWFEPPKSDSGKPRADTFLFVIRIN